MHPSYNEDPAFPEFDDRDYIYALDVDFDFHAQLREITRVLRRNAGVDRKLADEIEEVSRHARQLSGIRNEQAVEEWVVRMQESVYQDAAHSMAAVGMLAPFLETIFDQCFRGIRLRFFENSAPSTDHARWRAKEKHLWDCHYVWKCGHWQKDVVLGTVQLVDAVGLTPQLPTSFGFTLAALFAYRNKMLHCGFEWPKRKRTAFAKRLEDEPWPASWFRCSTTNDEPWIFYMSPEFVDHCVSVIGEVLDGIGMFVRDLHAQ